MFKAEFLPSIEKIENLIPKNLIDEIDTIIDKVIDGFTLKLFHPFKINKSNIDIINGFRYFLLEKGVINRDNLNNFEEFYDREIWNISGYLNEFLLNNFPGMLPILQEFYGMEFINSPFKSIEIFEDVFNNYVIKYRLELSYKSYRINYNIFIDSNSDKLFNITNLLGFFLKGLITLVYLGEKYSKKKTLEVYLMPTKYKKKVHSGNYIGPRSINSGFSVNQDIPKIYIFRDEEKDKVLIHEIIHALGFDEHNGELDMEINKLFGLKKGSVNIISEAWVDYWAIIFNCIINGYLIDEDPNKLLMIEREYSIKQAYEILKKLNYKLEELYKLEGINDEKFISSSAISYYVIKSGMLLDNLVFKASIDNYILDIVYVKETLQLIIGKIIKERNELERIIGGLRENDLRMTYLEVLYDGLVI